MTTDDVRQFLISAGKDRQWLADKIATPKRTIDGWFTRNEIPEIALLLIARIAAEMATTTPKFTPKDFGTIQEAMRKQGYEQIDDYIVDAVLRVAEEDVAGYKVDKKPVEGNPPSRES